MKILVSYLGRNQVFSLDDNDKIRQMKDLKQKVSLYFGITCGTVILQRFDKEWDTYLDLDEDDTFNDRDRLQVTTIMENTPAKEKSDNDLKTQLDATNEMTVNTYIHACMHILTFNTLNYKL